MGRPRQFGLEEDLRQGPNSQTTDKPPFRAWSAPPPRLQGMEPLEPRPGAPLQALCRRASWGTSSPLSPRYWSCLQRTRGTRSTGVFSLSREGHRCPSAPPQVPLLHPEDGSHKPTDSDPTQSIHRRHHPPRGILLSSPRPLISSHIFSHLLSSRFGFTQRRVVRRHASCCHSILLSRPALQRPTTVFLLGLFHTARESSTLGCLAWAVCQRYFCGCLASS